jgi:hypothetical protein
MPTGKATARPATSMAATSSRLATLKTTPPKRPPAEWGRRGLRHVGQERRSGVAQAARGQPQKNGRGRQADHVIPIKELEAIAGQSLSVLAHDPQHNMLKIIKNSAA